ncbi:RluA family pseudouridine synthase [Candidatus Tremblaya phenacola]|nr:RluA family pseudouridine synthase [Candidatus Tremblaya phenacola]
MQHNPKHSKRIPQPYDIDPIMNHNPLLLLVKEDQKDQRIESFLTSVLGVRVARSWSHKVLSSSRVGINNNKPNVGHRIKAGDCIYVQHPNLSLNNTLTSDTYQLYILYEDESIIAVDKDNNMPVHKGKECTVVSLIDSIQKLNNNNSIKLVHRIDQRTSGTVVLAKDKPALLNIQKQFVYRQVFKKYYTSVAGDWSVYWTQIQTIRAPLTKELDTYTKKVLVHRAGFPACSIAQCLKVWRRFLLLIVKLETGRTHQLRIHCSHLGFPVLGDIRYGSQPFSGSRLMLHSTVLSIKHPTLGSRLKLLSPPPLNYTLFLRILKLRT